MWLEIIEQGAKKWPITEEETHEDDHKSFELANEFSNNS